MTDSSSPGYEWRTIGDLPVLAWPELTAAGVDACVTTREVGVSAGSYASLNLALHVGDDERAVLANRERLAAGLGTELDALVFAEQVHGSIPAVVSGADGGRGARSTADAVPGADALITTASGVLLVILAADCVPLVLVDPQARVLACVHAGWAGTVRGVTAATLTRMRDLGADPARIVAGIGPAIHPRRYQVGRDVVAAAERAFGDRLAEVVRPDGTGRSTFDLWRGNALQLQACGVAPERIHVAGLDTGPGTPFYSHRSEGPCGRFALAARLREVRA